MDRNLSRRPTSPRGILPKDRPALALLAAALLAAPLGNTFAKASGRDFQRATKFCDLGTKALGEGRTAEAREQFTKAWKWFRHGRMPTLGWAMSS